MAESELRRTHPLTVAVRTLGGAGQVVGILFGVIVFSAAGGTESVLAAFGFAALALLLAGAIGASQWLTWAYFRYGIVGSDLLITEGWLIRKRRSIPLGRIQSVDMRAGVMLRIFGMVELSVQTAGGAATEPEAKIGAITRDEAEALRAELLQAGARSRAAAAASGGMGGTVGAAEGAAVSGGGVTGLEGGTWEVSTGEPADRVLYEHKVGLGRLALAAVTSKGVLAAMTVVLAVVAQLFGLAADLAMDFGGADVIEPAIEGTAALGLAAFIGLSLASILVAAAVAIAVAVSRDFGFTARRIGERVEIEAGLLERRTGGIPLRRIQSISIEEAPLRRLLGMVSVSVVTAGSGYSSDQNQQATTSTTVIPIASREELGSLVRGLLPEARRFPEMTPVPTGSLRFYLAVPLVLAALTLTALTLPVLLLAPEFFRLAAGGGIALLMAVAVWRILMWRHASYGTDRDSLGVGHGVLGRYRVRLHRSRIQSLSVRQNPFQRRAGVATLIAVSVAGTSSEDHVVRHMSSSDAEAIVAWYGSRE